MSGLLNQPSFKQMVQEREYRFLYWNRWYIDTEWKLQRLSIVLFLGLCTFLFFVALIYSQYIEIGVNNGTFLSMSIMIGMAFIIIYVLVRLYDKTRYLEVKKNAMSRFFIIKSDELVDAINELIQTNNLPMKTIYELSNIPKILAPHFDNHTIYFDRQSNIHILIGHDFINYEFDPIQPFTKVYVGPIKDSNQDQVNKLLRLLDSCQ